MVHVKGGHARWAAPGIPSVSLILLLATSRIAVAGPSACVGDCDGSGDVTVDEIITMVNIALGEEELSSCASGDGSGDGEITVDEIVRAMSNALEGCPVSPLGVRRFTLSPEQSPFEIVVAPDTRVLLGSFFGQSNMELEQAFIEIEAGPPDAAGIAVINVNAASEYIFARALFAPLTVCARFILPAQAAGFVDCDGGSDVSWATVVDHRLGQVGVDGFSAQDCEQQGGSIESPNQICEEGQTGAPCAEDADCNTVPNADDGMCGVQDSNCTQGSVGAACRADEDCDSEPGSFDGVCGTPDPHPGVCNGPVIFQQEGGDSGPGAASIGSLFGPGVTGLLVDLTFEISPPCGDEGPGLITPLPLTTGTARTRILDTGNGQEELEFVIEGTNLDCATWQTGTGGRLVFGFPALHLSPAGGGGDMIMTFSFGEALP